MPTTANEQTVDVVGIENLKTVAAQGAASNAMLSQTTAAALSVATQNMVHVQNLVNSQMAALMGASTTMAVNKLINVDPAEAVALTKTLTGDEIAQKVIAAMAALGGGQVMTKEAQTTPPVTAQTPPVATPTE